MKYTVKGSVRGTISTHRTLAAAIKSANRDRRVCRNLPGGNSYSDVRVYDRNGDVVSEGENE